MATLSLNENNLQKNNQNNNNLISNEELLFENAVPLSSKKETEVSATPILDKEDNLLFENAKDVSEPSAWEKLEYGWDKNKHVATQLLWDVPTNYLIAMFDSERDVKDVAIDKEKERIENFEKEHWKMLDGKHSGPLTFLGEAASFMTDPYYLAGYYFGSPLLAGGMGGSAILNASLLGGDNLINQLATRGEITSWGEVAGSAAIGGAIGAVMPIGAKVIGKYLPSKLKSKADDLAMFVDGKLSQFHKLTDIDKKLFKTIANKESVKKITNEIDQLVLSAGFKSGNKFYAPVSNAEKKYLKLKSKYYKEALPHITKRKEILKPIKGLTQKTVDSKTYWKNVIKPVKDRAKIEGKKILDIRIKIKAARDIWQTEKGRLITRQKERLNKYHNLEIKRTELLLANLKSHQGSAEKLLSAVLTNITRPLIGAATGASANIGANMMGYDVEDQFWGWTGIGFVLGGFQKMIQNSAKIGDVQQKKTLLKLIDNHAVQLTFQKLREVTAGTLTTKLAAFGGTTEKIGKLLFPRIDDSMASKSVWAESEAMEQFFLRSAAELIKKYTPEEQIAAVSINRGNLELAKTSNQNILNASKDIKLWLDEFKALYNKAGFFSPKELDNYFPRVLNWEAINANRPAAEKVFTEIFKKNYKLTQEKAEAAAKTYLSKNEGILNNTVINENAFNKLVINLGRGESRKGDDLVFTPISEHITKHRSLQGEYKIVEEVLEKNNFLINDLSRILPKIIQDSTKSIAFANKFGRGGQLLKEMIPDIQKKYSSLIGVDPKRVEKAMKHELRVVFDGVDAYFGKYGLKGVDQLPTTMGILTTLSNLQMLGRVTITSLGDIAQIFQQSINWTAAIKGMRQTNLFKAEWEKGLARSMNYDIVKYSRQALHKGAGREADEIILNTAWMGKFGVEYGSPATTQFYNSLAFKGLGLEWLTGYARRFAYNTGVNDSFILARKLFKVSNGGKNFNTKDAQQLLVHLQKYGIDKNQAMNIGRFKNWKGASKDKNALRFLKKAGWEAANRDALIPQAHNRLLFTQSKTPWVRGMGQFLSWVQAKSSSTNAILKRIENGEARTLIKTLAVIPVYAGIQQMREIAKHGDVITDYEYNTGELAAKSWQLSGMAGWLSDLFYNRFAGPGSKSGEFYAFAPMFQMGASIADMITSFAMGKPDRAWDVLDEKILLFPEWREWARKHWFPKGGKGGEVGVPSKTEIKFADGGFISRKKYNLGQHVTIGPTVLVNELQKDIEFNRKYFNEGGFADAFASARAEKQGTFEWQGNLYHTRRADETEEQYQTFLGKEEPPVKVILKEKPEKPADEDLDLSTIIADLKSEAIDDNPDRIFVSDLLPLKKEDIIIPKKKPYKVNVAEIQKIIQAHKDKENIIIPKKKPILKAKKDDGFSLISKAEASIPDDTTEVVENFATNENENDNTEVLSAPFRLLVNSFWTKWFGKKEDDKFTNNDFDKKTISVLQTVATNAFNNGRNSTHYTDYPLTKRGLSAEALVGEYKDVDGNRYSAEYKKKLEDEVNAVYSNNILGKAKFAYDLATDPVMKAIFSVGGFSIQEGKDGYFINEHFNFNSANQTTGTALKKIRKTISNMENAPVVEGSGPEVYLTLGWLNKDKNIKLVKKAKGGEVERLLFSKGDTPSEKWMRNYFFDGKGGYDSWMSFDEFKIGIGKKLYLESIGKRKGGRVGYEDGEEVIIPPKKPDSEVKASDDYGWLPDLEKPKKEFLMDNAKKIYILNESEGSPGKEIIPSSILISMAAHETGWGQESRFFKKGNNLFSLEAEKGEKFIKALDGERKVSAHNTPEENISKMLNWIRNKENYKIVRDTIQLYKNGKANKNDIIDAISSTGFAEDIEWASNVKEIHNDRIDGKHKKELHNFARNLFINTDKRQNFRWGGNPHEASKSNAPSSSKQDSGSWSRSYNPGKGGNNIVVHSNTGGDNVGSGGDNNNNNNITVKSNKTDTKTKRKVTTIQDTKRDDRRDRKEKKTTLGKSSKIWEALATGDVSEIEGPKTTDWETDESDWDAIPDSFDSGLKSVKINPNEVTKSNQSTVRVDTNIPIPGIDDISSTTNKFSSIIDEGEVQVKGEYERTGLLSPTDSFSVGATGYVGLDQTGHNTFTDFTTEKGTRLNIDYEKDNLFTSGTYDINTNVGTFELEKKYDSGWKVQGSADTEGNYGFTIGKNFRRGGLLDKNRG